MKVALIVAVILLPFISAASLGLGAPRKVTLGMDDQIVGFASEAINKFLLSQNAETKPHEAVEVISATKQVVAGFLYHITLKMKAENSGFVCDVKVVDQPWKVPAFSSSEAKCEAEPILGGDDHDYQPHGESGPMLGEDNHDHLPHGGDAWKTALCGQIKATPGMHGGLTPIEAKTTDDSVVSATEAINTYYLAQDANAEPRKAVEVICATSQIVAGLLYRYKILLNTNEICDVNVLSQAWMKPGFTTTVQKCQTEKEVMSGVLVGGDEQDNQPQGESGAMLGEDNHDHLPHGGDAWKTALCGQIKATPGMTGGLTPIEAKTTDDSVVSATEAINTYYLAQDANAEPRKAVEVICATSQVVAGLLYKYKILLNTNEICDVTVLSQAWMKPGFTTTVQKCQTEKEVMSGVLAGGDEQDNQPQGESGPLLGGDDHDLVPHGKAAWKKALCGNPKSKPDLLGEGGIEETNIKITHPSVVAATEAINDFYLSQDANAEPRTAAEVICATSKLVAGVKYQFKILMSSNDVCDIALLYQPWEVTPYKTLDIKCLTESEVQEAVLAKNKQAESGPMVGAEEKVDFNDANVQQALSIITDHANAMSNSMYRVIPRGGRATQQVVNGIIYRFYNMQLKQTSCRNSEDNFGKFAAEDCPVNSNSQTNHGSFNAEVFWNRKTFTLNSFDLKN